MPYTKARDPWVNSPATTTPVNATALNTIETGIAAAMALAEAAASTASVTAAVEAHRADTTAVHGITDTAVLAATTASFTTALLTKLNAIEALADVTDFGNVGSSGGMLCVRWSGSAWAARPIGATWGVSFLSTNDDLATPPADVNLAVGDMWFRHPDAV